MCIKDYETELGGPGPVRAVELLGKNTNENVDISVVTIKEGN
jgi:hypothetical protein